MDLLIRTVLSSSFFQFSPMPPFFYYSYRFSYHPFPSLLYLSRTFNLRISYTIITVWISSLNNVSCVRIHHMPAIRGLRVPRTCHHTGYSHTVPGTASLRAIEYSVSVDRSNTVTRRKRVGRQSGQFRTTNRQSTLTLNQHCSGNCVCCML